MNQQQELFEIGRGACGSVWATRLSDVDIDVDGNGNGNDTQTVIKREDCNSNRSITNEHHIHNLILARLAAATTTSKPASNLLTGYTVNIPTSIAFISLSSPEWDTLLPLLPPNFLPCRALRNERIPPMSLPLRLLLANKYIAARGPSNDAQFTAKLLEAVTTEQNFLVWPFLGRRRHLIRPSDERRPMMRFSLRNFPLHLDQMEELGLPVQGYAEGMADVMAFLHWVVGVDGADVEFVLARPRPGCRQGALGGEKRKGEEEKERPRIGSRAFSKEGVFGEHAMWLLDFDCCRRMTMPGGMRDDGKVQGEVAFLEWAAFCFWRNDPWFPRPPAPLGHDKNSIGNGDGDSKGHVNGNGNNHNNSAGSNGNGSNNGVDGESNHHLTDGQLWEKFKGRYLETSEEILDGKEGNGNEEKERMREFPGKVMKMIESTRGRNWFTSPPKDAGKDAGKAE